MTEVTRNGATGVAVAAHVKEGSSIAIAIATIPGREMTEETAMEMREKEEDATHVGAQVN